MEPTPCSMHRDRAAVYHVEYRRGDEISKWFDCEECAELRKTKRGAEKLTFTRLGKKQEEPTPEPQKESPAKATCQVCGRAIKANTGVIAHHGYQRPYHQGWQTASCAGAQYVPYEVSCDRLREIAERVKDFIASQEEELSAFLETPPQTITAFERVSAWHADKQVTYEKPGNFDRAACLTHGSYRPGTYELAYTDSAHKFEQTIKAAKTDLATMERRLQEWKPGE